MARLPVCLQILCLVLLLLYLSSGSTLKLVHGQKQWCVAKPSTDAVALKNNIAYACSIVGCSIIGRGQPCFFPNTDISHASVVMNLYYQASGRNSWNCDFNSSGLTSITDPSYDNCKYA